MHHTKVQEALESQKEEFSRREEAFRRREEGLRRKDLDLQEALIRFNQILTGVSWPGCLFVRHLFTFD